MNMYLLLFFSFFLAGCEKPKGKAQEFDAAAVNAEVTKLMNRDAVQGLALAVIEEGRVTHVKAYGFRNVEKSLPLTPDTIMYGASLTKTAVAYMVLQLVDEGKLDLDASVADLLPRPLPDYDEGDDDYSDLNGDARWRKLTPRIILTHSTGFANFRWLEEDQKLRFHYDPGKRYGYSGEGFYILQLILEKGLGLDLKEEMQARVFDRFGMKNTSMMWRADFAENLADGYSMKGEMEPHDDRSSASAAGSMDTSIKDQAFMWAGIMRGEGLSKAAREELVRPQLTITSPHQFPTLTSETEEKNTEIGLAAGLGLVTFQDATGPAWFKGGHNPWTGNMVICLEDKKRCLVMLANDVRAEGIYPEITKMILGETTMPWSWEYNN
jgi:CubicO group peptidase (beta-lactamase class C family)